MTTVANKMAQKWRVQLMWPFIINTVGRLTDVLFVIVIFMGAGYMCGWISWYI